MNPEFRQRINIITRNLESANETAQENIYTFTQLYIDPCLSGFKSCLNDCTAPCFPSRDGQLRRKRGRSRGRDELDFDFYDDWDDDEDAGGNLIGWGNDELDSLLAGNRTGRDGQPARQRAMSYGSRGRKGTALPNNLEDDPTIIPTSSYLGFLERLPWKFGSRGVRYKPSAADLQENPGGLRIRDHEVEPLIEEDDESEQPDRKIRHGRQRSNTGASQSTTNSLSSRGDLLMSDADDDAVPLDDEFAVLLSRRTTNTEDYSSGKTASSKRPTTSRASTRTASSKSRVSSIRSRQSSTRKGTDSGPLSPTTTEAADTFPQSSMVDLIREEDQIRREEEMEVEQKREAAQKLAVAKGLESPASSEIPGIEIKPDDDGNDGDDEQQDDTTIFLSLPLRQTSPHPFEDEQLNLPPTSPTAKPDEREAHHQQPP